jgi:uncharacterized metal-binding protein
MIGLFTCFGGAAYGMAAAKACMKLWEENNGDIKIICLSSVAAGIEEIIEGYKNRYDTIIVLDGCETQCASKIIRESVLEPRKEIIVTKLLNKSKKAGLPTPDEEAEMYNHIRAELIEFLPKLAPACVCLE